MGKVLNFLGKIGLSSLAVIAMAGQGPVQWVIDPDILTLQPNMAVAGYELRLRGPSDIFQQFEFKGHSVPFIEPYDEAGEPLPNGLYTFELHFLTQKSKVSLAPMVGRFLIQNGKLAMAETDKDALTLLRDMGVFPLKNGQLGLGTATPDPGAQIHMTSREFPALRLEHRSEQNGSGFFWDLRTVENGFGLFNKIGGSERQPVFFAHGAPNASLVLNPDGKMGMGTQTPDARIHVVDRGHGDVAHIENRANSQRRRNVLTLENHGEVAFQMKMNPTGDVWSFLVREKDFLISRNGSRAEEMRITEDGTLYTHGSINPKSDAASKAAFQAVDTQGILNALAKLPLQTWRYKHDSQKVRHLGPTAQDFRAAFDLGADDGSISVLDSAGVALAAIQALEHRLETKSREVQRLHQRNQALENRLTALETKMNILLDQSP